MYTHISASCRSPITVAQHHGSGPPSPDPDTYEEPGKSYLIRADVHVDHESKVFTALLELPGVRKDEVRVTLSSCSYNGVKQVTISGRTRDPFASSEGGRGLGKIVRERKYGRFIRTFAVASDTKVRLIFESVWSRRSRAASPLFFCGDFCVCQLEDVDVAMDDGVVTLKIQNRPGLVNPEVQEVPIR